MPRCMSLARRAPPCAVCAPATAQLLLPRTDVVVARRSEADRRTEEGESAGLGRRRDPGHGLRRLRPAQVDDLRPRDGGHRDGVALDRCVPLGADGGEEAGERRRERLPHQAEHGLLRTAAGPGGRGTWRGRTGASPRRATSRAPTAGPGTRRAGPRGRRGPRSPPTCRRRACPARPPAAPSRPAGRRAEAGGRRASRSISSAGRPKSAASSPAALRRRRSIWKKRSCACRKPVARATSRRLPPRTTGTPSASRSIRTGAPRPATARSPSICGRLARSRALRYAPPPPAARATAATVPPRTSGQRRRLSSRGTSVRPGPEGSASHFAFDWLATASAAFFAASGSPR